jgi:hypothetical protein
LRLDTAPRARYVQRRYGKFRAASLSRNDRPMSSRFEDRYSQLKQLIEDAEEDMMKFYEKGNKAAGTRARKHMMALKDLAHEIRQEIQEIKNTELS